MKTKSIICLLLIFTTMFSCIGYAESGIDTTGTVVSDIDKESNLPNEKITEESILNEEMIDFDFLESQNSFEPLNVVPYKGISVMATSTDSNIVAGVKQFQQYINANLKEKGFEYYRIGKSVYAKKSSYFRREP